MKIKTLGIALTGLDIPVFGPCSDKTALNIINIINARDDNDKIIAEAKAVIMSSTGLSLAIAAILRHAYGDTIHIENMDCNESIKKNIVAKSNNVLSKCEEAFSQHSVPFDEAVFAYAKKIHHSVGALYSKNICKNGDTVIVLLENFLLVPYKQLQCTEVINLDDPPIESISDEDNTFM